MFAADIQNWSKMVSKEITEFRNAVAVELFTSVISDTPVLTGQLRANWKFSRKTPDYTVTNESDKGDKTSNSVRASILESKILYDDETVILANSMPYAYDIETGKSKIKAPEGMVERNFNRIVAKLI